MIIKILSTGSRGNCYSLEECGHLVLLDLGISLPEIKRGIKYRVSDVAFSFVSHGHKDHSMSEIKTCKMGINVFAPYHSTNLMQTFKTGGWYLKSFPLYHGEGVNNCGVFIRSPKGYKMVYATDFQRIDYKFDKLGINTFLIECNHDDEISKEENEGKWEHAIRDHSSVSTICEFLRVNLTEQLQNVILCHASENNLNEKDALKRVQEVVGDSVKVLIAKKGVEINLDE